MKIYRGGFSNEDLYVTDSKAPGEYIKDWKPGETIHFDGTIDKSGQRHTVLGVHLESDDVLKLHSALIRYLQAQKAERDDLEKDVNALKDVLCGVGMLIRRLLHTDDDKTAATIEELAEICDYYGFLVSSSGKPYKPKTENVRKHRRKWPSIRVAVLR